MKRVFLASFFILASLGFGQIFTSPVFASECATTMPVAGQVEVKIAVKDAGDYKLWLNQLVSTENTNSLYVQLGANCPIQVAKNLNVNEFGWISNSVSLEPLVFSLKPGEYSIFFAGDGSDIALDSGFLTTNMACVPAGLLGECTSQPLAQSNEKAETFGNFTIKDPKVDIRLFLVLMIVWSIALAATVIFMAQKYRIFLNKRQAGGFVPQELSKLRHAVLPSTMVTFVKHHPISSAVGAFLFLSLLVAFVLGVRVLAAGSLSFQIEDGALSGSAKIVKNDQVAGGAFVAFGKEPVVVNTSGNPVVQQPQSQSQNPANGGNNNGGNSGGGDNNNGGGGNTTPAGECPAYPAFPDQNCTGWRHTGVTLTDCTPLTDNGYIWDGQQTVFDSCYFSTNLTIQAANVKITRSQVHGVISYHWSNNYSFRGLQLIDVEVEQEGYPSGSAGVAISGSNWSCLRCDAHHTVSGMHFGDNTHIRDSYTHDFYWQDGSHGAGIGTGQDHGSNSTIIHNNIQCNRVNGPPICSSALSIYPEDDNGDGITLSNVQVEKNLFNATGAYCVYAVSIPGSNINFRDNYFGKKFYSGCAGYGPVTGYGPDGGVWINNIWADGSGPVIPS